MALYRLEAKIIGRKYPAKTRGKNRGKAINKSRSVVAASAYRSGSKLHDERTGILQNYKSRSKEVIATTLLTPEGAPAWAHDPNQLWNRVEAAEKRKDAQLAREFILAVPPELTQNEQFQLAVDWVNKDLVSKGMIAEVSLHHPKTGKNPHVHVLCTLRTLDGDTFSAKKSREWNDRMLLREQRASWCAAENAALEKAGRPERVDHRSLKDRGIDRIPQPKIGKDATALKRSGEVGDPKPFQEVRWVESQNQVMPQRRDIERTGEVNQRGMGRTWWEKSIIFMSRVRQAARETVMDTWRMLLDSRSRGHDTGPAPQKEPEISR